MHGPGPLDPDPLDLVRGLFEASFGLPADPSAAPAELARIPRLHPQLFDPDDPDALIAATVAARLPATGAAGRFRRALLAAIDGPYLASLGEPPDPPHPALVGVVDRAAPDYRPTSPGAWAVAAVPGSRRLVVACANGVAVLDPVTMAGPRVRIAGRAGRHACVQSFPADLDWVAVVDRVAPRRIVRVWQPATGQVRELVVLPRADGPVELLADPAGEWLIVAHRGEVSGWQPRSGQRRFASPGGPFALLAAPADGSWFAHVDDEVVQLRDPVTGAARLRLPAEGPVDRLVVAPDGSWLAAAHADRISVWDARSGRLRCVGSSPPVHAVPRRVEPHLLASPDGRMLVAAQRHDVRVWRLDADPVPPPTRLAVDAWAAPTWLDDDRLAVPRPDCAVEVWSASTGERQQVLPGPEVSLGVTRVSATVAPPGGTWLAVATHDLDTEGRLRVFDTATGRLRAELPGDLHGPVGLVLTADGSTLAAPDGLLGQELRIWDVTDRVIGRRVEPRRGGHRSWVWNLLMSATGGTLVSRGADDELRVWDPVTGRCRHVLGGPVLGRPVIDPADAWVAAEPADGRDGPVRVWDLRSGELQHVYPGVRDVRAFRDADGGWLTGIDGSGALHVWSPLTGMVRNVLRGGEPADVLRAVAPDGAWALTAGPAGARLWDPLGGSPVRPLPGGLAGVLLTGPDWVAGIGAEEVHLWRPSTGEDHRLPGAGSQPGGFVVGADGSWFAAAVGGDGDGLVWDVAAGTLRRLPGLRPVVATGLGLVVRDRSECLRIVEPRTGWVRRELVGSASTLVAGAGGRALIGIGSTSARRPADLLRVWDLAQDDPAPLEVRVPSILRTAVGHGEVVAVAGERGPYLFRITRTLTA